MTNAVHQITQPNALLALRTLGDAGLYADNGASLLLGPGKPLALLVFLALAPGRRTSRESLIDLLWSDVDPERARPALRQTLFHLRRLLGDDSIGGSEELTLNRAMRVDRDDFLDALDHGDLERALTLYAGAFLPAFGVPGGAMFEHWADVERDRLETGYIRATELMVRRHLNQSRFKDGKQLARQARELVPQAEATARLLLEALVAGRDFVAAAMEADVLEQWAAHEEIKLETSTRSAIARARRVVPAMEGDHKQYALVAELTGREHEFFSITSAWDAVRAGPSRHLHLIAPAGFGKTRLLRDALARLSAAGAAIVQLRGTPGDRDVPYAFAGDLAAAIAELPGAAGVAPASASTLVALNPALSTQLSSSADQATGEESLRRRILAIADLVQSVADEQRFVLAIDDLHWIDLPSYRVLEGVCARLGKAHVLCLTTARPERAPSNDSCTLLTLSALTPPQVHALVSALGVIPERAEWSHAFVTGLHEATRGSPLLVLETLRLALDQGTLMLNENEWCCSDPSRLASLLRAGEAVRERVRTLPKSQQVVLATLAVAGVSLDHQAIADACRMSAAEVGDRIAPLERNGLVAHTASGWMPVHDEIAEAARDVLTSQDRANAERSVGEYFACVAGDDTHALVRAARHFVAAGDTLQVNRLFARYAQTARERGDRRAFAVIAGEFVGGDLQSTRITSVVKSLPRLWRAGLWSRARQVGAAIALLLLPTLAIGAVNARTASDLNAQRIFFVDSARATTAIAISAQEFDGRNTALKRKDAQSVEFEGAVGYTDIPPAISPDGNSAAWTQATGDSTILDIWLRTPKGARRLTSEPRDDVVHAWLADGSAIVGTTNRWSPKGDGDYDIAVFDTVTGAARQITHGRPYDNNPSPSPDGTRIAFRRDSDETRPSMCIVPIDGASDPECRSIDNVRVGLIVGWAGLQELVVTLLDSTESLFVYDWARNTTRRVMGPQVRDPRLSRDRRWVVASIPVNGIRGKHDWIAPLDNPSHARPVDAFDAQPHPIRWWQGPADQSFLIDRIEFADTTSMIMLGVGTQLRVRPLTAANAAVPLLAPVRWYSSDTLVATVDSTGVVTPRTLGEVTVTASLVGWREVTKRIRVGGQQPITVLDERWTDDWRTRWILWGDPQPEVVDAPSNVRAFFNNGDGNHRSVGILRQTFSATYGIGAELRIWSRITRTKWQRIAVNFMSGLDTALLRAGDQHKDLPTFGRTESHCGVNFPGDGKWAERVISLSGNVGEEMELSETEANALRSGQWWTLRLQILPDGRCGIAINNRVIWVSPEPSPLDGGFRLRIGDNSYDTRILHGRLQVWTGVRTDIDWSQRKK